MNYLIASIIQTILNPAPVTDLNQASRMASDGLIAFSLVPVSVIGMLIYFYIYLPYKRGF